MDGWMGGWVWVGEWRVGGCVCGCQMAMLPMVLKSTRNGNGEAKGTDSSI